MKLYEGLGPNPRVVNIFLAEKGVELEREKVDIMKGENRRAPHIERNPSGQIPCLELDDGSHLSEVTAICEYLEERHPEPPLVGATPEERAETRMWVRRIDLNIVEPMSNGFRYAEGLALFKDRVHVIPQAAEDLKAIGREKLGWLDGLMGDREWICGRRFTLADILLFAFLEFASTVGQPLDPGLAWLAAWEKRVAERPSVAAG